MAQLSNKHISDFNVIINYQRNADKVSNNLRWDDMTINNSDSIELM